MYLSFSAAAIAATLPAVHAQGSIFSTDSEDFQRMIYNLYDWTDAPEMANVDMIGYCVMGDAYDDKDKAFKYFNGEFEGLTPMGHYREP